MKTYYNFGKNEVPFTQVATAVFSDRNLSAKAKGIYGYLYSKPNDWWFSFERIAREMKDGVDSILAGIRELENAKLLKRVKHGDGRVTYWVTFPPGNFENPTTEKTELDEPTGEKPKLGKTQIGKNSSISNKDGNSNKETTIAGFDAFWEKYPSKVSKKKALEMWRRLKPGSDLQQKIMAALENHIQSDRWARKFIPHPSTWIYQERWTEVLEKAKDPKKNLYFQGNPVVEKNGKKYVIENGQWLLFAGKQSELELR